MKLLKPIQQQQPQHQQQPQQHIVTQKIPIQQAQPQPRIKYVMGGQTLKPLAIQSAENTQVATNSRQAVVLKNDVIFVQTVDDQFSAIQISPVDPLDVGGVEFTVKQDNINEGKSLADKYSMLAQATTKQDYSHSDSGSNLIDYDSSNAQNDDDKPFVCRHCGKRYRWKSTLRRHENVECGGKEPNHQCPYCEYKAKQKGNLGVHVRKHHPDLPALESRRKLNRFSGDGVKSD